jgi:hypothetical protein
LKNYQVWNQDIKNSSAGASACAAAFCSLETLEKLSSGQSSLSVRRSARVGEPAKTATPPNRVGGVGGLEPVDALSPHHDR